MRTLLLVVSSAGATVAPQLLALLVLGPADYGAFAFAMVIYGLCLSASQSIIIDPWLRESPGHRPGGLAVHSMAAWLAAPLAVIAAVFLGVANQPPPGVVLALALAVIGGVTRNVSRSWHLVSSPGARLWMPDLASVAVLAAAYAVLVRHSDSLVAVSVAWSSALLAAGLLTLPSPIRMRGPSALQAWVRQQWSVVRPLWVESSILDAGVAVNTMTVSIVLSASGFGIYRAVSSALVPIRLVLQPLRARIASVEPRRASTVRFVLVLTALAVAAGASISVATWLAGRWEPLQRGVVPAMSRHWLAIGITAALQTMAYVFYVIGRVGASVRRIRAARSFDSALLVLAPIAGGAAFGTSGAIWGLVLSSCGSVVVWRAAVHDHRTGCPSSD